MTVSSSVNRIQFAGDATTLTFSTTPVKFFTSADIDVIEVSAAGVATTLALTTDYTVTGGAGTGSAAAIGTVSTSGLHGTVAVGKTLVIVRRLDVVQAADFVNNDASDAEVVEAAFDKAIMIAQQNTADIARSLVAADGYTGTFDFTVPSEVLTNAGGSIIVNTNATGFAAGPTASAISGAATQAAAASVQATAAAAQAALASISATAAAASAVTAAATVGAVKVTTGDATASVLSAKIVGDSALGLTVSFTAATGTIATIASTTAWITGRTEDTAPDPNADYINTFDNSATAIKKVRLGLAGQPVFAVNTTTTSGITVSVTTAIPSWVRRVHMFLDNTSLTGTADILVQVGSTTFSTSGYVAQSATMPNAAAIIGVSSTAGFIISQANAALGAVGRMTIEMLNSSNTWIATYSGLKSGITACVVGTGEITLGGALDRLRLISSNGSDTFDNGNVLVTWE